MNRGGSLTSAARSLRLPSKDLQQLLSRQGLLLRKANRWVPNDDRLRQVLVITGGRIRPVIVRGYKEASVAGEHFDAAGKFVSTNDPKILKPYKERTVQAANGRRYVLETDPNALHRIAAMDSPPFHEIYKIVTPT